MLLFFLNSDSSQAKPSSSSSTISSTIVTGTAVFKRWLIWPIFTELISAKVRWMVLRKTNAWDMCYYHLKVGAAGWSTVTITSSLQRFSVELNGQGNPPAKSIHDGFNDLVPHATASPPRSTRVFWRPLQTLFKNFNLHIGVVPGVVRHCLNYFFPLYLVTLKESINFLLLKQDKSPAAASKF